MRFFLFGQGEGVRADSQAALWAAIGDGKVTDASISARQQGVKRGMTAKSAQALIPGLVLYPESEKTMVSQTMQKIWGALWKISPWLETISEDSFLLQIPSAYPPIREVRDLSLDIQKLLNKEQRFRLGLAENPFLARALVEWSRLERVPGATYLKVREQELLLSPSISKLGYISCNASGDSTASIRWIRSLPISALWPLPGAIQTTLLELGVRRLADLEELVNPRQLQQRFGTSALTWLEWLKQQPGGRVHVNYPPAQLVQIRQADAGEYLLPEHYPGLLDSMATTLARELERSGNGALQVGMVWETHERNESFEKISKRPIYQRELLLAQLTSGMESLPKEGVERLELYVRNIQPLTQIQMTFWCEEGAGQSLSRREQPKPGQFYLTVIQRGEEKQQRDIEKLIRQVNQKFPNGLKVGIRPTFRELRLNAVLQRNSSTLKRRR